MEADKVERVVELLGQAYNKGYADGAKEAIKLANAQLNEAGYEYDLFLAVD